MLSRYLPVFLILALLAEVLGTIGGFGSSVFFVPVANFYFDFQSVLGITALFHLSSNVTKIAFFRKGLDKRLLLYLGIPAIIFVSIGAFLSKYVNPGMLGLILGVFLIVLSLVFLIFKKLVIEDGNKNAIAGGVLSGLSAGLLGTGGAIRGIT
ncbi:MAG: sulfite exporter TauE/SafE family protein, partial [Nonlabens ulvanivorans]